MIHEDLEGEALKAEVLRVARRGSVYDLDVEMTAAGQQVGVEIAWLGVRSTLEGDIVVFRFFVQPRFAGCTPDQPALAVKLRHMVKSCDVLLKEIAWHPLSESGVLTVLWDSVTPMGHEPLGPRRMDSIRIAIETGVDVPEGTKNFYRRYVSLLRTAKYRNAPCLCEVHGLECGGVHDARLDAHLRSYKPVAS